MNGWVKLRVSVACDKCGVLLYSEVVDSYQTKGGRWERSLHILKNKIGPHHHCEAKNKQRSKGERVKGDEK